MRFHFSYLMLSAFVLTGLLATSSARSEETQAGGLSEALTQTKEVASEALPIEFMNRPIFTIRSGVSGFTQEERAQAINARIKIALDKSREDQISMRPTPEGGRIVELNGAAVFQVRPTDLDPLTGETIDEAAQAASQNLLTAVHEAREQGKGLVILKGAGYALLATLLFYLSCRVILWGEAKLIGRLQTWARTGHYKLATVIQPQQLCLTLEYLVNFAKWILIVIAGYEWATYTLIQFPYSRPWGERLHSYLINTIQDILLAIIGAMPSLFVVFFIVLLTRLASGILKAFFTRIETSQISVSWVAEDTARTTRKLTQTLLWLFAAAMAYPYFPGSDTDAFKGLSVLAGLMISIGGSGVVGQAASGLIMIYSRVLREGEYVKVNGIEGTVTRVGIFSTKIKTANGEEINVPNALIGSSTTINSSRLAEGKGLVLHTAVTIGYNTPWRQVHAMLLQAAERTSGIRAAPKPYVSQTALSDFYVEYCLCVQIDSPQIRCATLSALHANIQDVFNESGVQIMSPHYVYDPKEKVWIPKEQWFEAPASDHPKREAV